MIDEDALPDARRRMNIHRKDIVYAALEKVRNAATALSPQCVRRAVALQGLEPLVVEERNKRALASRVASKHSAQVIETRSNDRRVAPDGVADQVGHYDNVEDVIRQA